MVDNKNTQKNVQLDEVTEESIEKFIKSVIDGEAKAYGLTDKVEGLEVPEI